MFGSIQRTRLVSKTRTICVEQARRLREISNYFRQYHAHEREQHEATFNEQTLVRCCPGGICLIPTTHEQKISLEL